MRSQDVVEINNGSQTNQTSANPHRFGLVGNLAKKFIDSKLTPLIILVALLLGLGAILLLPREEEPPKLCRYGFSL